MLSSKKTIALLIHDGVAWRVVVLRRASSGWAVQGVREALGRNINRIPDELLEFAASAGVRRLRVLTCTDVQLVRFQVPPDVDPEEFQTALRFEYEHEIGGAVDNRRLAAAAAEIFDFGAEPGTVLASSQNENTLKHYAQAAAHWELRFAGAGALELAALAWVGKIRKSDVRLLLLEENSAFYMAPGIGELPLTVAKLAVGTQPDRDSERENERIERAARRLAAQNDVPVTVLCCSPVTEQLQERLAPLFENAKAVEWHALPDVVGDIAKVAAATPRSGLPDAPCPLVGPTPPPRDPHRWGTWVFFAIVLMAMLASYLRWQDLKAEECRLAARKELWEEVQAARDSAAARVSSLRAQRDAQIAKRQALSELDILPPGVLTVLDALAANMPPYTRIETLSEIEAGQGLQLCGRTTWQAGLTELTDTINAALKSEAMSAQLLTVQRDAENERELFFTYTITTDEVAP